MKKLILGVALLGVLSGSAWAWNCFDFTVVVYPTDPHKRVRLESRQFGSFDECDRALDLMIYKPGTDQVRPNVKVLEACPRTECTVCN